MKQVASLCDKIDYTNQAQIIYFSSSYNPKNNLSISFDLTYTWSKAYSENPNFPNPPIVPTGVLEDAMEFTNDFSTFRDEFNLDMRQLDLSLGINYKIMQNLDLNTTFTYRDFDDREKYVEDRDGNAYMINAGILWRF